MCTKQIMLNQFIFKLNLSVGKMGAELMLSVPIENVIRVSCNFIYFLEKMCDKIVSCYLSGFSGSR